MAKHKKKGFTDRRDEKNRNRVPAPKHRMFGPPQKPTLYDLLPQEFTSIKGAGGHT